MEPGRLFLRSAYAARVFFQKGEKEDSFMKKWTGAMFDTKGTDDREILSTDRDKNNKEAFYCPGCNLIISKS
jgi:hypothetical protein